MQQEARADELMKPYRILESLVSQKDVDYILVTAGAHGLNGDEQLAEETMRLSALLEARKAERKAAQARGEAFDEGLLSERMFFAPGISEAYKAKLQVLADQLPKS